MPRIMYYRDAKGGRHLNTVRANAPFKLMTSIGDYFEVDGSECLAGNLSNLASLYSLKLGRRFQFRTLSGAHGGPVYRVTLVSLKLNAEPLPSRGMSEPKSPLFRVDVLYDRNGAKFPNVCHDERGRKMMYPLGIMSIGDYYFVQGCKARIRSAIEIAQDYGTLHSMTFEAVEAGTARVKITRSA